MKKVLLILSAFFMAFTASCKTSYNLQNSKDADAQILEDIRSKKIVFIGENHSTVFPILYMTQNMERFYEAGVRYLFLEEEGDGFLPNGNYDDYKMQIVPPWCTFGCKYEYHQMEVEIARINKLHSEDPIKVIFPETGAELSEEMSVTEYMNARDAQAQKTIIQVMDSSKPEDKAIIFYGSSHGCKNPTHYYGDEEIWYTTGWYMKEHYKNDFSSFDIDYLFNDDYTKVDYGTGFDFKIFPEPYLSKQLSPEHISDYDYFCVTDQRIYGIIYPYIITEENLTALYKLVSDFDYDEIEQKPSYEIRELMLGLSYLKYCFGDYFPFDYEKDNLQEALLVLDDEVFKSGKPAVSFCTQLPDFSMNEWEKYAEYLFSYGWLEGYLYGDFDDDETREKASGYVIYNMEHAAKMNSSDPWPVYWTAYFKTEKAKLSGKESDYKKALEDWKKFMNHPASPCCAGIGIAYDRIALCYSELGESELGDFYLKKAEALKNNFILKNGDMYYFGE